MIEVRRLPRNYTAGYERIPNHAIDNYDLSLAAIGLLTRLLRGGEQFSSIAEIADFYAAKDPEPRPRGRGRDSYLAAAKELEKAGYLVRTKKPNSLQMYVLVTASPNEATQFTPTTAQAVPARAAQTGIAAARHEDGSGGLVPSSKNDAFAQLTSTTAEPSSFPPGETGVSAGRSDDGSAVPFYTDCFTDHTPPPGAEGEGSSTNDEQAAEKPGQARALIAASPIAHQLGRTAHARVLAAVDELLGLGWPESDLSRRLAKQQPPVVHDLASLVVSWLPEAETYRPPAEARASSESPRPPHCGDPACNPKTRMIDDLDIPRRCPTCHPQAQKGAP